MQPFDVVVRGGRWFDGTGAPSAVRDLGIRNGRVEIVSAEPLDPAGAEVIDAEGKWVMPGFIDIHTHYDAEVLMAPGLGESVRHGVTTVTVGSCSLSTVHVDPVDGADLFSRVEAVPREHVLAALEKHKNWDDAAGYVRALENLPLGPNVAAYLGHSDLRTHVLGLSRAVGDGKRPTAAELQRMERELEAALDAGFVGLSTMTSQVDKIDGALYRSRALPSTYARWREYHRLHRVLRRRGRVIQSAPNLKNPANAARFVSSSMGYLHRKRLKTSLLVAADSKAFPFMWFVFGPAARLSNLLGRADFRWQHLPAPFELYCDGIDLVIFEEFGAGEMALHLADELERTNLLQDEAYRRKFRLQYGRKLTPRMWQRDFYDAEIVACPDARCVGRSFGAIADERGIHPVDAYLDLVVAHGRALRWKTTVANHRPRVMERLAASPGVQIGFADSGAHLRTMAFYNFALRFLKRVRDAELAGRTIMSTERAVHRVTGELAEWYGLDAGRIREGDRADLVVVDPAGLDESVEAYAEAEVPEFGGLSRMVRRNDAAVVATLVGGNVVYRAGRFSDGFGERWRAGRFLRAGEPRGTVDPAAIAPVAARA